ncbi:hypothetical protein D3C86_2206950 [compost metagenome]
MPKRHDFGNSQRATIHDATGKFATSHIALHHDEIAVAPLGRGEDLRRMRHILTHDHDAKA